MKDPEIRALLRPTLPPGIVINEVEIRAGSIRESVTLAEMWADAPRCVRADVVLVNDGLAGYEIKSAADSRVRLPRQVEVYSQVFDRCTMVTEPRHAAKALPVLPPWWGVLVVEDGAVRERRPSEANPGVDPIALAKLLWKTELWPLLRSHGVRVARSASCCDMWRLAPHVPIDALRARVREALVERRGEGKAA